MVRQRAAGSGRRTLAWSEFKRAHGWLSRRARPRVTNDVAEDLVD
jgi:hypothetical protein